MTGAKEPRSPDALAPGSPPDPQDLERFLRSHRLLRGKDFRRVLLEGHRQGTPHLVVHLLVQDLPTSRLGVTLSRKVGNAVARNRVRRRLREMFRRRLRIHLGSPCADVVVRAERCATTATQETLATELEQVVASWIQRGRPQRRGRRRAGA